MASRLLNVRLDDDRLRKVRRIRESGVALSDLVREAIDARFEGLDTPMTGAHAASAVERILAQHPDPADVPARTYDVHDASAARTAISRALAQRRR